jgi:hypothetical protein
MSRRSKKHRLEKLAESSPREALPSASGNTATTAAASLFPPESPTIRQKWCLAAAILLEITWIVILLFLAIPV